MKRTGRLLATVLGAVLLLAPVAKSAVVVDNSSRAVKGLEKEIRHELIMLPFYNVFDYMSFSVQDGRVTLLGSVTRPTLKTDAERAVKRIEGVESIDNRIEVLPLSPFDDRVRLSVYRSIYGYGSLGRYSMGAVPAIRILVKNGNVTLEGSVMNEMDRNLANIRANGVSGVFSVTNNLRVDG